MDVQIDPANMVKNPSMPPGVIIPVLIYDDVTTAVEWLCSTFGFKERLRIGNHRCQLVFSGASIVVPTGGGTPSSSGHFQTHSIMVCVEDVDGHFAHVKQSDAHILNEPQTHPFGERQYSVEDIGGHVWTFSQSVANVSPDSWGGKLLVDS